MNIALRKKILTMVARDQAMRASGKWDTSVDERNAKAMKSIVDDFGWPGNDMIGAEGAEGAWLLVQHADQDKKFQRRMLPILRKKAREGTVSPLHYAYLLDRVNVNSGKRQRYGTQFGMRRGKFGPRPIGDRKTLDARRKSVGLGPFREYLKRMTEKNAALQKKPPDELGGPSPFQANSMLRSAR